MTGTIRFLHLSTDSGAIQLNVQSALAALAGILILLLVFLLIQIWRLSRNLAVRQQQQDQLRLTIDQLSRNSALQIEQLQQSIVSRVSETNREQREINALFLTQMQQANQGSGQMLETIRQSIQEQMAKIAGNLRDMQAVAGDVRSLRQALGSVRGRGVIGELQLEQLLADVLAPSQYRTQVRIRPGRQETVDAAVLLSSDQKGQGEVFLPIDAKFPLDYLHRLLSAREADDEEAAAVFSKELIGRLRQEARKIAELYVEPPVTTDFAILYLPGENLFAEAMRDGALASELYRQHRILLAGPTSMASILAGLQAIFRLQSMERQSLEIARALSRLQHDFQQYETSLERIHGRLVRSVSDTESCIRFAAQVRHRLEGLDLENREEQHLPDVTLQEETE
ncbi:MAG: DNA recombination protein RmuC [Bacillota bacterium]|nr:DNA recombination protein RmuC [Bacillota bacterium]